MSDLVEVGPGRWKPVERCSDRDRVAAALILTRVGELADEVDRLHAALRAVLGDDVVLPDWASPQLADLFDSGWEGVMPSVVTMRRVRDDFRRWVDELPAMAGAV